MNDELNEDVFTIAVGDVAYWVDNRNQYSTELLSDINNIYLNTNVELISGEQSDE